ncbi:sensor histidine kinase [Streptomyces sp. NPDC054784]
MTETGEVVRTRDEGCGPEPPEESGPWWWERPRAFALDLTLAVLSVAECAYEGKLFSDETGVPLPFALLMGVVVGAVLLLRRRYPVLVVLVTIAVTPAEMGILLNVVGLYTLAATDVPRRITGLLAGMQVIGGFVITAIRMHQSIGQAPNFDPPVWFIPLTSLLMSVAFTAPPVLLGLYVGARRRLVESLRERADGLERELSLLADRAEERAEWARNEERTRIAREMHDVVAHRVSLMVVHASALQTITLKDPEKASRNAALVGDMGRRALTELRTMLGVLRSGDPSYETTPAAAAAAAAVPAASAPVPGSAPAPASAPATAPTTGPGSAAGAATAPAGPVPDGRGPTLGELDVLVGQSREAGMAVELTVEGTHGGYAAGVEQTAFRVVQEALTNVHKHAAGARTRVRLAHREAEVALQVENEPPAEGGADAGLPSGGNGLVGMRERVTTLGGVFVSGPTDAGGFRVSAVIPRGDGGVA